MIVLGIDPGLAERRSCVFAPGELEYTTKKSTTRRWLKNRRGRGKITPQAVESPWRQRAWSPRSTTRVMTSPGRTSQSPEPFGRREISGGSGPGAQRPTRLVG